MALFYRWDRKNKRRGEPITLSHSQVKQVRQLIINVPGGRRNCSRVDLHDAPEGEYIELDCTKAEVQDRLNDDIATCPVPADLMEPQAPLSFTAQDQDDDEEEEEDTED